MINWPDLSLTTVAVSLIITDSAGLAQGDTAGGAGKVTQTAPESSTHQAGSGKQHKHRAQRCLSKHSLSLG